MVPFNTCASQSLLLGGGCGQSGTGQGMTGGQADTGWAASLVKMILRDWE